MSRVQSEANASGRARARHEPAHALNPRVQHSVFVAKLLDLSALNDGGPWKVWRKNRAAEDHLVEPKGLVAEQRIADDVGAEAVCNDRRGVGRADRIVPILHQLV